MEPSFLFSGLHFNQKRFGTDLQLFKKVENVQPNPQVHSRELTGNGQSDQSTGGTGVAEPVLQDESVDAERQRKKKKRKTSNGSAGYDNALNIFKSSAKFRSNPRSDSELSIDTSQKVSAAKQVRNSKARREEEIASLRKKHSLHVAGQSIPPPLVSFDQLRSQYRCKKALMRSLTETGRAEPTPIQRQAIPILLERRECLACAPTGSGKTLAFLIPIAMNLMKLPAFTGIRAVILCPVRELAAQTAREFKRLVPAKKLRVRVLTTALFKNADFTNLPCDILVSTPLRLEHLLKGKKIDLSKVEYLIMDESDKLFEMGFVKQIDTIVGACSNPSIVRALFSATLPDTVEELARTIMHDAIRIIVGQKNSAASTVEQKLIYVGSEDGKLLGLRQIFKQSLRPPVLLFVDSKERAKMLHRELAFEGIKVDSIHSDKVQEQRNAAVEKFREGKAWVLISTDLMARGMDFKGVNCVINYDFPQTTATYIHRIGRSGRAGRSGQAITLYTDKDVPHLRSIANVMRESECDVPEWMLALPKVKVKKRKS